MILPQQGSRIVWLVRILTAIGLAMVVTTIGLVGWRLAGMRHERAHVTVEQDQLNGASRQLRERAGDARAEIRAAMDETLVGQPQQLSAVAQFAALIRSQLDSPINAAVVPPLMELRDQSAHLTAIAERAQVWHTSYLPVWKDLQEQRTMSRVRELISELRSAMETRQGRRRLDDAIDYKRWQRASGEAAARQAQEILIEQGRQQSVGITDFGSQLAEFARLVELLGGEERYDSLTDLKDNKLKPVLDRLTRSVGALRFSRTGSSGLAPHAIEDLKVALFGEGYRSNEAHQNVEVGSGGLFALRRDALQLRRERETLKSELAGLVQEIESANASFAQTTQLRTAALTQQMEQSLAADWNRLLLFGTGCAGLFLWLAWRITRGIDGQVHAIELARTDAEASRQTAQALMLDQQRANAELASAHQGLQASEQRFRMLSASAPIGIFETDAAGGTLYTNPHWEQIAGISSAESLGEGWAKAIHADDLAGVRGGWRVAAAEGTPFVHEFRFCRPDGEVRWVHVRSAVVRSTAGECIGHVGTVEDISERRLHEERLRTSLQEVSDLKAALDEHALVSVTDPRGVLTYVNDKFCAISKYSREELLGQDHRIVSSGLHPKEFIRAMWKTIAQGRVWKGEFRNRAKDGSFYWVDSTIVPFLDADGKPVQYVAIRSDITERKNAEFALEKMHRELLETSRQAGMAEVATAVLHNVGNVLNSVNVASMCVADLLRRSKASSLGRVVTLLREHEADLGGFFMNDPRSKQLPGFLAQLAGQLGTEQGAALAELAHLQKNIEHIKEIVSMQQAYSKVSGVTETVQLAELVEDTLRMNAESFAHHDVRVVRDFAEVPPVTVERHKVLQVLVNLVRNAKHACDAGVHPEKTVTLRVYNGDGTVKIAVSDNGVGIPAENLARIFNHGFTTKKDGHGFGLHSGALAAQEMGGALRVESKGPGTGATFTLELPLSVNGTHRESKKS